MADTADKPVRMMTVPEVADLLRYSVPHVHGLIKRGEIEAVICGRRTTVHPVDVTAFLERHRKMRRAAG
jgi:excisionase family DNA binding protein